jgi:hypothetical protein
MLSAWAWGLWGRDCGSKAGEDRAAAGATAAVAEVGATGSIGGVCEVGGMAATVTAES